MLVWIVVAVLVVGLGILYLTNRVAKQDDGQVLTVDNTQDLETRSVHPTTEVKNSSDHSDHSDHNHQK